MALHQELSGTEIHTPFAFVYADATARENATGLTSSDVNKLALQEDNHTVWVLTDASGPTWVPVSKDMSASDILAMLKTVDGTGSGLDADTLDGHDSSYFATASDLTTAIANSASANVVTASNTSTTFIDDDATVTHLTTTVTCPSYGGILVASYSTQVKSANSKYDDYDVYFYVDSTNLYGTTSGGGEIYKTFSGSYGRCLSEGTHTLRIKVHADSYADAYVRDSHITAKVIG